MVNFNLNALRSVIDSGKLALRFIGSVLNLIPEGAMGSYAAFYLAGLYPVPATEQYLLSSPFFKQISFYNPAFNTTTIIKSKNLDGEPEDGSGGRVFVQVWFSHFDRGL